MINSLIQLLKSIFFVLTRGTDYNRWENEDNLLEDWNERVIRISKLIPANSRVLEFGAGNEILRGLLQNCFYTPSDITQRSEATLICDLNSKTLPFFEQYDIVVFSGVLEYVHDVQRILNHIKDCCQFIITSYAPVRKKRNLTEILKRRANGWVNDYNESEFIKKFSEAGFAIKRQEDWRGQKIYLFSK